jgi:hypothetical protein
MPKQNSVIEEKKAKDINKLKFVVANSFKYKLFKSLVKQIDTKQAVISICSDISGKTAIFIGPFDNETKQQQMIDLIKNQNIKVSASNITEQEFDARCNP